MTTKCAHLNNHTDLFSSIMASSDIAAVERLLRAVYRPHNVYCIHVNARSEQHFYKAVDSIAACFPNVFIPSKRIEIQPSTFTVLESELVCMEELYKHETTWKYFINLHGKFF